MHGPEMLLRNTSLGPDISPLNVIVEYTDSNILHIKIGAPGRWEVPDDLFINTGKGEVLQSATINDPNSMHPPSVISERGYSLSAKGEKWPACQAGSSQGLNHKP